MTLMQVAPLSFLQRFQVEGVTIGGCSVDQVVTILPVAARSAPPHSGATDHPPPRSSSPPEPQHDAPPRPLCRTVCNSLSLVPADRCAPSGALRACGKKPCAVGFLAAARARWRSGGTSRLGRSPLFASPAGSTRAGGKLQLDFMAVALSFDGQTATCTRSEGRQCYVGSSAAS